MFWPVDFGRERWDLIAIIYALEKRSVAASRGIETRRLVVIEAGHSDKPDSMVEYRSIELLKISKGSGF